MNHVGEMAIIREGLIEEDESNILLMITLKENNPKARSIRGLKQLIKKKIGVQTQEQ